jgi:hypothetical protein
VAVFKMPRGAGGDVNADDGVDGAGEPTPGPAMAI